MGVKELKAKRSEAFAELERLVNQVANENRDFTPEEAERRGALKARIEDLDERIAEEKRRKREQEKREKAAQARAAIGQGDVSTDRASGIRVIASERTYRKGGPFSYMADLVAKQMGNSEAAARLARHAHEVAVDAEDAQRRLDAGSPRPFDHYFIRQVRTAMAAAGLPQYEAQYRALSTAGGAGGEFVPPLYLTEQYVPYARPNRVFADACHKQELPPGTMSLNIPKVTGGTSTDTQGAQNTAVSDTDLTTAYVTFPVVTIAGQQVISLQLLERSPIAFDDVVFRDLHADLARRVDAKCLAGAGAGDITGVINTTGISTITWSPTGGPTVKGFYGVVAEAKANVATTRFLPATHIFLRPEHWEWLEQQLDSSGRPLIVPRDNGPWNAIQATGEAVAEGETGSLLLGLRAFQDFNIPVTSGNAGAVVAKMDDLYLYESPVIARALPQTYGAQLSVLLQVYEYVAFTASRYPQAAAWITGTGFAVPVTFNS